MRYRPLGRTGQFVSEICLGTMTFTGGAGFWKVIGRLDQAASTALVGRALEAGVNFFDTADVYSEGQSEISSASLRDWGRAQGHRRDQGARAHGSGPQRRRPVARHILDPIAASLKRLGIDRVDLYQIHGFDPVTPLDETLRALDDFVARACCATSAARTSRPGSS